MAQLLHGLCLLLPCGRRPRRRSCRGRLRRRHVHGRRAEGSGLVVDELLEALLGEVVELHLEAEGLLRDGLVLGVVVLVEVRVRQGVLHLDAAVRVEGQHLLQQVEGVLVRAGVEPGPRDLWLVWQ